VNNSRGSERHYTEKRVSNPNLAVVEVKGGENRWDNSPRVCPKKVGSSITKNTLGGNLDLS